ncbi:MAG: diguanylate cyclase [Chloroflexi bacterium]|nr:diguanylate cyclase [Chloroflexota bacterium]
MELKIYLRMIKTGWWIVLLTIFSALNVALVVDYFATPQYQATARLIVVPNTTMVTTQNLVNSLATLDRPSIVNTYSEVLNSSYLYESTISQFNLTVEEFEEYTQQAIVLPDSNIIELTITGPNPNICAGWANSVAQKAIDYVNNTYQVYQLNFLDKAISDPVAISPQPLRDIGLAVALGLIFGVLLAIVREQIRTPLEELHLRRVMDPTLGCFNRTHIERMIADEAIQAKSGSDGYVFSVAFLNFEMLVDYQHDLPQQMLNDLLRQVVSILREQLRGNDGIGHWDRFGLIIILPNTPYQAAERILNRIRWEIHKRLLIPETNIPLDFIFGISRWQSNDTLDQLLGRMRMDMETNRYRALKQPEQPRKPEGDGPLH